MGALHLPPKKPSELQQFIAHFEGALEARYELWRDDDATPGDAVKAILDAVAEARKEMGW